MPFYRKKGNKNWNLSCPQSAFLSASGACLERDFVYEVTGAELIYPFIWSDFLCVGSYQRQIHQFDASWENPLDVNCSCLPSELSAMINI